MDQVLRSKKKKAEDADDGHSTFRLFFERAREMFFVTDKEGRFLAVNPYGARLLGYDSPSELLSVGSIYQLYYYPQDESAFKEKIELDGFVYDYDITLKKRDGSKIPVSLTGNTVKNKRGKTVGYEGIIRDYTERRRIEKELLHLERLAAMGKLSAEIAHEINNPLGGILMYAKLASEEPPQDGQIEYVKKIVKLATRCRMIIRGLLDFGRREEPAERQWVDMNRTILDMFDLVRDHILFREARVEMRLGEGLPLIWGNRGNLEQVALNMMINAAEAMEGQGTLTIETGYNRMEGLFCIRFNDTGPGIRKEYVDRIFEPFFTTKKRGKGTGLGLSIVHGVIQKHGGSIQITSKPAEGTTFTIQLPASAGNYDYAGQNTNH